MGEPLDLDGLAEEARLALAARDDEGVYLMYLRPEYLLALIERLRAAEARAMTPGELAEQMQEPTP